MKKKLRLLFVLFMGTMMFPEEKVFFPADVQGWKAAKEQTFNQENLYQYIDGASELYISYGFRNLISRTYVNGNEPEISVDFFDMGDSRKAYGIFSHDQENPKKEIGQGSEYQSGLLRFWKDRYFVSILAAGETQLSREAVMEMGRKISSAIPFNGPLPEILFLPPVEGLVKETLRYFFHHAWQNSHYHFSDENTLGITGDCQAVTSLYGPKGNRMVLLLVLYPSPEQSVHALENFLQKVLIHHDPQNCGQMADRTWSAAGRFDNLLALVFKGSTRDDAWMLLKRVEKNQDKINTGRK